MLIGKAKCRFFKVNQVIGLYRVALAKDALGLYDIGNGSRGEKR